MMIYIAADLPLDLVGREQANQVFHVADLLDAHSSVRQQFSFTQVYYVGAYEGCGCGFQLGQYPDPEDEKRHLKRASLDAFAAYLERQLERAAVIDVFACWDGDQAATPEHHRRLTPPSLHADDFYFREKELSRIGRCPTDKSA